MWLTNNIQPEIVGGAMNMPKFSAFNIERANAALITKQRNVIQQLPYQSDFFAANNDFIKAQQALTKINPLVAPAFNKNYPQVFKQAKIDVEEMGKKVADILLTNAKSLDSEANTVMLGNNIGLMIERVDYIKRYLENVKAKSHGIVARQSSFIQAVNILQGIITVYTNNINRLKSEQQKADTEQKALMTRDLEVREKEAALDYAKIQRDLYKERQDAEKPSLLLPLVIGGGALATILAFKG